MPDTTTRPVILLAETLSPATIEALGPDYEVRHCNGADPDELRSAIGDVDAVMVRSASKITAEVIAAAPRLKVIARAGVGLDNVDVKAATQAGVMVVNAPTSNIISAAEHAIGLLLAVARRIAPADASLRQGEWKRSSFGGVELYEKTLGVVGLGRIGVLVAQRLSAFGMDVIAYDPFVPAARAAQMGVRLVTLPELLAEADILTVHLPKTPETLGLIDAKALSAMKPTAILINAARGGIVDEAALADALRSNTIAGAGLDVFSSEPCTDSPLFSLPNVVVTPHLGASTDEAQEKAGVAVARSVRLALAGELVPDAVNVKGGAIDEEVRPAIGLAEKLGQIFTSLAAEAAVSLDVEVRGDLAHHDVKILELAALKGVFAGVVEHPVSYVNAPVIAADRGVEVRLVTQDAPADYRTLITVRGALSDGRVHSVSGTLVGARNAEKLVEVDGFDIEVPLTDHMAFYRYTDRPGVIGTVGQIMGEAGINIAGMQVSRDNRGGQALAGMSVDSEVPNEVLATVLESIGADFGRSIDLDV